MLLPHTDSPRTVMYSPPSCTIFAPCFAKTFLEATTVQKPVSSQFQSHSAILCSSNCCNVKKQNKDLIHANHLSNTTELLASALFLVRCDFLCISSGCRCIWFLMQESIKFCKVSLADYISCLSQ